MLTPGIGPRWDPWPYICSMSRSFFFFLPLILLIDKGGIGLFIYRLVFTYYTLLHLRLHSFFFFQGVKVKVTLLLTVSQSVRFAVEPHLGLMTRYLLLFNSYGPFFLRRPL
jgi:hypothetical protein